MSAEAPDPSVIALESALAQLRPSAGTLTREQLLFRAGQASIRRHRWPWPCATAASLLLAASLGLALLTPPEPQHVQQIVLIREPAPAAVVVREETRPPISTDYLHLREQVLRCGLDALPPSPPAVASEPTPSFDFDLRGVPGRERRPAPEKPGDPS